MTSSIERLPAGLARRIALAAQGFADPRPAGEVGTRQLRRIAERLGVVQIDSVNVLSRSHYLPALQPAGPVSAGGAGRVVRPAARPVRVLGARGVVPAGAAAAAPALADGRGRAARLGQHGAAAAGAAGLRRRGPRPGPRGRPDQGQSSCSSPGPTGRARCGTGTPARSPWSGSSSPARSPPAPRTAGFERVYDLTERVLPPAVLQTPTPERADAIRELVRTAARALGVATETDLRDYFRLPVADVRPAIAALVEAGELQPVRGRRAGTARPGWTRRHAVRAGSGRGRC